MWHFSLPLWVCAHLSLTVCVDLHCTLFSLRDSESITFLTSDALFSHSHSVMSCLYWNNWNSHLSPLLPAPSCTSQKQSTCHYLYEEEMWTQVEYSSQCLTEWRHMNTLLLLKCTLASTETSGIEKRRRTHDETSEGELGWSKWLG